jgi:SPP1 gp7 family putative phage head morphogenesis protein
MIQQKLAAKLETLQIEKIVRVETIADLLASQVAAAVGDVLSITQRTARRDQRARDIAERLRKLPKLMTETASTAMVKLGQWSHAEAGRIVAKTVPRKWMRAAQPAAVLVGEQTATEDAVGDLWNFDDNTGPISGRRLTDDEWAEWCAQHVWPAPPPEKVTEIVQRKTNGIAWQDRMQTLSKLIEPEKTAGALIDGFAEGLNVDQLTKRVLPHVTGNVASSARRIARTEGLRIANEMQREMYNDLGDLMVGMQIWATLDQNTRPEHAARHGRIHYKNGNPGLDTMPSLPDEPNCRCFDIPVMKTPESIANDPKLAAEFRTASGNAIPDAQSYNEWFRGADEGRRKMAVGAKRYNEMAAKLGQTRKPEWTDFIDADGKLLSVKELQSEDSDSYQFRQTQVRNALDKRRQLIQQISSGGFEDTIRRTKRTVNVVLNAASVDVEASNPITTERIDSYRRVEAATKQTLERLRKQVVASELPKREQKYNRAKYLAAEREWRRLKSLPDSPAKSAALKKAAKKMEDIAILGAEERRQERERVLQLLEVPDPLKLTFDVGDEASPDIKRNVSRARDFLQRITSRKHAVNGIVGDGKESVTVTVEEIYGKNRAYFMNGTRRIHLHRETEASVVIHEAGHALEDYGEVHELAKGFLYHRVGKDKCEHLPTLFPMFGYEDYEYGRDDDFGKAFQGRLSNMNSLNVDNHSYYAGKQYRGATEVLSMGVELLYNDPVGFARKDPEWFRFTVGILRGDMLP